AQQLPDSDPDKADLVKGAQDAVDMLSKGHQADLADKLRQATEAAKARGLAINLSRVGIYTDPVTGIQRPMMASEVIKTGGLGTKQIDQVYTQFIKPAADFEKNYQTFEEAYKDFKNGTKTGAASMVATGMHIATSLGGVKGARVGPEIIAEHIGAR